MHSFLVLFVLVGVAIADKCGSNCPSGKCPSCPCGSTRRMLDSATWCSKFTGWNQACCRCIVSKESGGNANAINYNGAKFGYDVGLWQINQYYNWRSCNRGNAPCDPNANLECAKQVWRAGGNSFKQWSTAKLCGC
ncbi:unnamed protein product [Rotaria sordida]|uniref:Transglycosylase SLT domain-containing protein n=1 Tax=Rotaria sordida TaxID=392033 RepID=A0A814JZG8_9BILA|nr:unnamed protein product [Rotaria sordida]CAF3813151.1 unnamed protein product [Rotaria sordida]